MVMGVPTEQVWLQGPGEFTSCILRARIYVRLLFSILITLELNFTFNYWSRRGRGLYKESKRKLKVKEIGRGQIMVYS